MRGACRQPVINQSGQGYKPEAEVAFAGAQLKIRHGKIIPCLIFFVFLQHDY
jgi:hypothetical protein